MPTIHEIIKKERLKNGYTLAQIANMLGVKEATVQRYESGEIKNIKTETILKLSRIFKRSPSYLMGEIDEKTELRQHDIADVVLSLRDLSREQLSIVKTFVSALKGEFSNGEHTGKTE